MDRVVLVTDRSQQEALPPLAALGLDVEVEPFGGPWLDDLPDLGAAVVVVDCASEPDRAFGLLAALAAAARHPPVIAAMPVDHLDRFAWDQVADDVVRTDASPAELLIRLRMVVRRVGEPDAATVRVGPLTLNT
jgi:DNA-binding response OmpR family regulator